MAAAPSSRNIPLGLSLDPSGRHVIHVRNGKAFLYDAIAKQRTCDHDVTEDKLTHWLQTRDCASTKMCPECDASQIAARPPFPFAAFSEFNSFYFSLLNKERDWTAPQFLSPEMLYGTDTDVKVTKNQRFVARYNELDVPGRFVNAEGERSSNLFGIAYDVWEPREARGDIPLLILTHGVPMNRREWYDIARILGRFMRVITYDLLGMGGSSMPLDFKPSEREERSRNGNPDSHWSWALQARICQLMINKWRGEFPEWFSLSKRVFYAANDWGAGAVQKAAALFSKDLWGAGIFSAIALDGYWVQHIGSLQALALLPYPSPTFTAETVRFAGVLTGLLETMFHRTAYHTNQYNMAHYQEPYVEISYSDVNKNPGNTKYKAHPVRVLAQQAAAALGNGELLPFHPSKNPRGMDVSAWNTHILMLWGKLDKMMPEAQRHRFSAMVEHLIEFKKGHGVSTDDLSFHEHGMDDAGHFAIRDKPLETAHEIISWIRRVVGPSKLASPYIGLEGIARQDEQRVVKDLKDQYDSMRRK